MPTTYSEERKTRKRKERKTNQQIVYALVKFIKTTIPPIPTPEGVVGVTLSHNIPHPSGPTNNNNKAKPNPPPLPNPLAHAILWGAPVGRLPIDDEFDSKYYKKTLCFILSLLPRHYYQTGF